MRTTDCTCSSEGSWVLVTRPLNKVTLHIIPYNPNEGAYKLLQFRRVSHAEPRVGFRVWGVGTGDFGGRALRVRV